MQDRVSLYPGRVKLTPVSGQENTYDMVRADEPTQEGTPLSKATFLKDDTAALFGLDATAVPDDLFKTLGAELRVTTEAGTVVTASKDGVTLRATADSSGLAVIRIPRFGAWTLKATINGKALEFYFVIDAIAVFNIFLTTNLEAASWSLISGVVEAGKASSVWSVGDTKTIELNGVSYTAQIIDFNHDTKTAGGKAGITFQLVDCLNTKYQMNSSDTNKGGWTSCTMRTSVLNSIFSSLPADLQKVIKPVNKLTSAGSQSATINTTSDKLFLLSEVEIFGSITYSKSGEGSQYAYYKAGNSKAKKVNGSASDWWERSPYKSNNTSYCCVLSGTDDSGGDTSAPSADHANISYGVSFAFCV